MSNAARKGAARAVADVTQGTIIATVEIAAPIERVFQALTDGKELVRWWGSADTYRTTEWVSDLRVGGKWRAGGKGADGNAFSVEGDFLEVEPPRKLVQTWKPDWDGGHVTTITYRLEPAAGGTRVTVRHEGFAGRPESCQGHTAGWERVLEWLNGYVAPAASASPGTASATRYFLCRLLPPRPTFPQDMTLEERKVMQEHVAYWTSLMERGIAIAFGPVGDPKGVWGLGLIGVDPETDPRSVEINDPTIKAGLGFKYEIHPMLQAIVRR